MVQRFETPLFLSFAADRDLEHSNRHAVVAGVLDNRCNLEL